MKILTILSTKGGVGKSTIAVNFAVEAARRRKRVLLVDADSQASSMNFRAIREKNDIKAMSILTPTLHKDLGEFDFDIIIIDAGGRDTDVCRSAILAADLLLIPTKPSQPDIWGVSETIDLLKVARIYRDIPAAIVLNQVVRNTKVSREATEALEEFSGVATIIKQRLHYRVAFSDAFGHGLGVTEYEKKGQASQEIKLVYKYILKMLEETK